MFPARYRLFFSKHREHGRVLMGNSVEDRHSESAVNLISCVFNQYFRGLQVGDYRTSWLSYFSSSCEILFSHIMTGHLMVILKNRSAPAQLRRL